MVLSDRGSSVLGGGEKLWAADGVSRRWESLPGVLEMLVVNGGAVDGNGVVAMGWCVWWKS